MVQIIVLKAFSIGLPRKLRIILLTITVVIVADGFVTPDHFLSPSWMKNKPSSSNSNIANPSRPSLSSTNAVPSSNENGNGDRFIDDSTKIVIATTTAADDAKESYLLLAAEAYTKYYSKQRRSRRGGGRQQRDDDAAAVVLSQEEYLNLALTAWNNGVGRVADEGEIEPWNANISGAESTSPTSLRPFPDNTKPVIVSQAAGDDENGDRSTTEDNDGVKKKKYDKFPSKKREGVMMNKDEERKSSLLSIKSNKMNNNDDENVNKNTAGKSDDDSRNSKNNNNPLLDMFSKLVSPKAANDPSSASSGVATTAKKFNPIAMLFDNINSNNKIKENDNTDRPVGSGGGGEGSSFFKEESSVPYGLRNQYKAKETMGEKRPIEPVTRREVENTNRPVGSVGGEGSFSFGEESSVPHGLRNQKMANEAIAGEKRPVEPVTRQQVENTNGPDGGSGGGEGSLSEEESSVPNCLRNPKKAKETITEDKRPVEPDICATTTTPNNNSNLDNEEISSIGPTSLKRERGGGGKESIIMTAAATATGKKSFKMKQQRQAIVDPPPSPLSLQQATGAAEFEQDSRSSKSKDSSSIRNEVLFSSPPQTSFKKSLKRDDSAGGSSFASCGGTAKSPMIKEGGGGIFPKSLQSLKGAATVKEMMIVDDFRKRQQQQLPTTTMKGNIQNKQQQKMLRSKSLKGTAAKGIDDPKRKGLAVDDLKAGGILTEPPLEVFKKKQQQVDSSGMDKANVPFMKKSDAAKPFVMERLKSLVSLKGAAAKGNSPKKGLSFGSLKTKGSVSPQPPMKGLADKQQVDSPGFGKSSMPFKNLSVIGIPKSFESFSGRSAEGVDGLETKGLAGGNMNTEGDIPLPQPPPLNIKDKQSFGVPFMKKSPNTLESSAKMTLGDKQPVDSLDVSKAKKGDVSKGSAALLEKRVKKSPKMNQNNNGSTKSSTPSKGINGGPRGFPSGLKTPGKGLEAKEMAAENNEPSVQKKDFLSGLQTSKGALKQMAVSVPPPSSATELPVNRAASFAQTAGEDFGGDEMANYGAAESQVSPSMNTDDEMEKAVLTISPEEEPWLASLGDILGKVGLTILPLLHIGNRIRSSVHGTAHEGFLVLPMEDANGDVDMSSNGDGYRVMPCTAKRPWSMAELNATVQSKISAFEREQYYAVEDALAPESWELDAKAATVRRYHEVEIHVFQKFEQKKTFYERLSRQERQSGSGSAKDKNEQPSTIDNNVANIVVPKFLRVYPDDGSGSSRDDDAIPEYGLTGLDVWGETLGVGHEWLVYEGRVDAELTLLEAMEVQHQTSDKNIQNGSRHHLYGIQQAMNLPDSYEFGDVLDVIFRCLLEDLVFLSSCNVVHRDLRPGNILCDGENQRLRLTNFGNAVDLDPPRVGLENDSLELDAPGSIANTLAADVFSVGLIICQLLFDVSDDVSGQLKDVGYDLDAWLQKALADANSCHMGSGNALDYLRERRGLWSLLKGAIRPNPLRKKITADSLRQFNEIMGLKTGEIRWTNERMKNIASDESVLELKAGKQASSEDMQVENKDSSYFDITRAPYKLEPPTKTSLSALSELQSKSQGPAFTVKANSKTNEEAVTTANNEYIDVTRLKFSPTRKSLLTNMLASYAKERPGVNAREKRQESLLPEGEYFDITRAPFRKVSPQPSERKASQNKATTWATIPDNKPNTKRIDVVHIIAPAGKLGVVVDNPPTGGPTYVFSISGDSPLVGQIYLGDRIVAVDDENVQQLMSDDISKILLSKSANDIRKISLLREIDDEEEPTDSDILMKEANNDDDTLRISKTQTLADEKHSKEVEQWLLSHLPYLKKDDAANYCKCLIDDGFDSLVMLEELIEEDLYFMKTAHRRVMSRKLSWVAKSGALPFESLQKSLAVKKVYKVDEALGVAARLGIERKLAEEKRLAEVERQTNGARKRVEGKNRANAEEEAQLGKFAPEKDEREQRISEAKELIRHEARVNGDKEAQLQTFEEEREKLYQQLESEAAAMGRARQEEFERLQNEARGLEETEAWIAEQNESVRKAKEKKLDEEEDRYAARQAEFVKSLAEEAKGLKETEAWIAKQNELVKKRHHARIGKGKQLNEEEDTITARRLEFEDEARRLEEA